MEKVEYSLELIRKAVKEHEVIIYACSFGKDSIVVEDLLIQVCNEQGRTPIRFWNDTTVEFPETYKFAKERMKEIEVPTIITRPEKNFWSCVNEYGWPGVVGGTTRQDRAVSECCKWLKKQPTNKALKQFKGQDVVYFTGLTRFESDIRELQAKKYGDYFYSKKWKHWKCHPIQNWTEEDVWEYHRLRNLPYNPIYDMKLEGYTVRTGCWTCTIPVKYGKLKWLRIHQPRLYKILVEKKGLGRELLTLKGIDTSPGLFGEVDLDQMVREWLEVRPCFFDKF